MRTILHSDLNAFYASVECLRNPSVRTKPVVVVGAKEERHGIVLAKNAIAANAGVKTGDVCWEAKRKCGGRLVEIQADFSTYLQVSKAVRAIYEDYTDRVEAYGIDECWLDITDGGRYFDGGRAVAEEIRARVKKEIGLTVSVGVSWNKIFAKLASDMKKPDAVTEITPENYKQTAWRLPVEALLYVGGATKKKLNAVGIRTIGELASAREESLAALLGKWGSYLYRFANGKDDSPVVTAGEERSVKSLGNSLTVYRDLTDGEDVKMIFALLADSVAARMREAGLPPARTVGISARSSTLISYAKREKLAHPTGEACELARAAYRLFCKAYPWEEAVRSLGISVTDFLFGPVQTDLFSDGRKEEARKRLNAAIDGLRNKYGNKIIQTAIVLKDPKIRDLDIRAEHVIHPYSFFRHGSGGK